VTDYVKVKFIQKCPKFKGTDLQTYGPYEKGETEKVPKDNADILKNRNTAKEVQNQ